jgi:hypothetical protein
MTDSLLTLLVELSRVEGRDNRGVVRVVLLLFLQTEWWMIRRAHTTLGIMLLFGDGELEVFL